MKLFLLLLYLCHYSCTLPLSPKDGFVEKTAAFSLAQNDNSIVNDQKPSIASIMQGITENSYFKDFIGLMKYLGAAAEEAKQAELTATANPARETESTKQSSSLPSTSQYVTSSVRKTSLPVNRLQMRQRSMHAAPSVRSQSPVPLRETQAFIASASMDDTPVTVQKKGSSKSILNEEWAHTLFGERGVLTGIFQMVDQQRKSTNVQADPTSKIDGKPLNMDFKKIFDQLIMGSKGEFDSPGPELPEFLGICNRLSCGDIYKAIDKFRKSEFFSNFQTAMSLVQDPNGLETLGKLISNPELISQFAGANSGMEELFGSALGEAKKESSKSKDKNSRLLPEDGDFGTDFTDMEEGKKPEPSLPEIDFSIDSKRPAGNSDYYEEVSKGGQSKEESESDYEDLVIDVAPPTTTAPVTVTTRSSTRRIETPTIMPKSTVIKKDVDEVMPELSFSVDGDVEESIDSVSQTVDAAPPPKGTFAPKVHSGNIFTTKPQRPAVVPKTENRSVVDRKIVVEPPMSKTFSTTTPPSVTSRPTSRITFRTTTQRTTTRRNHRKDSDYYAMYYDEQG